MDTKPEDEWELVINKIKKRSQLWICMADENCRNAEHGVKITSTQASSATTYLPTQHKQGEKHEDSCC